MAHSYRLLLLPLLLLLLPPTPTYADQEVFLRENSRPERSPESLYQGSGLGVDDGDDDDDDDDDDDGGGNYYAESRAPSWLLREVPRAECLTDSCLAEVSLRDQ